MRLLLLYSQEAVYGHENAFHERNKDVRSKTPFTPDVSNKDVKTEGQ